MYRECSDLLICLLLYTSGIGSAYLGLNWSGGGAEHPVQGLLGMQSYVACTFEQASGRLMAILHCALS